VALQKCFLHSSLVLFFFFIPTHKIKTGTANRWETIDSKPPGPITMIGQSETQGAAVRAYLLHSSLASVRLCCVFYQRQHTVHKCWAKTILLSQTSMFWLFFIQILICRVTYWALVELLLRSSTKLGFLNAHKFSDTNNSLWSPIQ